MIMKHKYTVVWAFSLLALCTAHAAPKQKTNFLVITADDMNWDSVGCFGAPMKNLTPNIDKLASQGIRFDQAHVASTVCMPSRNALNSGRLPHRSGGEGFHHFRFPDVPTIPNILTKHGYKVGILGKVNHSTPYENTPWDLAEEIGRNTPDIKAKAAAFVESSKADGKPFYLIVNSHDPHRPYYRHTAEGTEIKGRKGKPGNSHPSRVIHPDEVVVPKFVPDTPAVRNELADYYCSVRRCDDVVGAVLAMLDEKGLAKDTLVFFLSDHGMGAPSAKGNAYLNSTKTPMVARWPGRIKPGQVCQDYASSLDILPTLLDTAKISSPGGFDGVSLVPAFQGLELKGRGDIFFTQFYTNIGKNLFNMRTAHRGKFAYTYNTFHNGDRLYSGSSLGGSFFQSMVDAGKTDPKWAARAEHILRRTPEELYDIEKDPSCMKNLIDNPEYAEITKKFRKEMGNHLKAVSDPVEPVYATYIETGSVEKMWSEYEKVVEATDMIGHIPNPVNMERWLDPEGYAAAKKARKSKSKK
jgi:N-sulfoglucosamine sulfohydrolase